MEAYGGRQWLLGPIRGKMFYFFLLFFFSLKILGNMYTIHEHELCPYKQQL